MAMFGRVDLSSHRIKTLAVSLLNMSAAFRRAAVCVSLLQSSGSWTEGHPQTARVARARPLATSAVAHKGHINVSRWTCAYGLPRFCPRTLPQRSSGVQSSCPCEQDLPLASVIDKKSRPKRHTSGLCTNTRRRPHRQSRSCRVILRLSLLRTMQPSPR